MKPPKLRSIQRRLLLLLLAPLTLVFCLALFFDYRSSLQTSGMAFDHGLSDDALALAARVKVDATGNPEVDLPKAAEAVLRTDPDDEEFFSAWTHHGRFLAGDVALTPQLGDEMGRVILSDAILNGRPIRRADYAFKLDDQIVRVVFAETLNKRDQAASQIFLALLIPNILLIATSLGVVYFGVQFGLAPLARLGQAISLRSAEDLSTLPPLPVPAEAAPLVTAMNDLMARLQRAAANQRQFITDAAHQLRTPLAALQTQLELAAGDRTDQLPSRIANALEGVRRLNHVSQQLLALARLVPESIQLDQARPTDLATVINDIASGWFDVAERAGVDLSFDVNPAPLIGRPWLLGEIAGNLIDNAIRYSGRDASVVVRCGQERNTQGGMLSVLEVSDNGPGISDPDKLLIFKRFHRGQSARGQGSGLGLAIVEEACHLHGASIRVHDNKDGPGSTFRIAFPATVS